MIPTLLESGILAFFVFFFALSTFGNRNFESMISKISKSTLKCGSVVMFIIIKSSIKLKISISSKLTL